MPTRELSPPMASTMSFSRRTSSENAADSSSRSGTEHHILTAMEIWSDKAQTCSHDTGAEPSISAKLERSKKHKGLSLQSASRRKNIPKGKRPSKSTPDQECRRDRNNGLSFPKLSAGGVNGDIHLCSVLGKLVCACVLLKRSSRSSALLMHCLPLPMPIFDCQSLVSCISSGLFLLGGFCILLQMLLIIRFVVLANSNSQRWSLLVSCPSGRLWNLLL